MTFERFKDCVESLNKYFERENQFTEAIELFNSSYTIIEFCPEIIKCITNIIEEEFNDIYDNFSYWYWEQNQGEKADRYFITEQDGTEIKNKTIEDIYNYLLLVKNSKSSKSE